MKRVYVAGKYNGPDVLSVLSNMRRGIDLSIQVIEIGMAPFSPWLDFQFGLQADIQMSVYKECSMAWVSVCDALILVPGWENSNGVKAEIEEAKKHGIPVFTSIRDLTHYVFPKKASK